VITDGLGLMNLVLFWRDEVPADWDPIAPGKDPRIACEIPIDFGTGAAEAISEQSVAVRGYSAVVVNDLLSNPTINPPSMLALGALAQNSVSALEGGIPDKAPFGLERIDWDPETRNCETVWANSEVSLPNGIPSISRGSGLVYGAGQRNGQWGLEGLDFETGESRLWVEAGSGSCRPELMMVLSILPGVAEVLEVVPDSCENSFYAATTIGPDGTVYQGTLNGVSRYVPATSEPLPADEQAAVGVEQALDLLDRSQSDAPSNIGERNYLRRAIAQLLETQQVAASAGIADIATAAANAMQSLDEAVAAFDAAEPHDSYVQDARAALSAI